MAWVFPKKEALTAFLCKIMVSYYVKSAFHGINRANVAENAGQPQKIR